MKKIKLFESFNEHELVKYNNKGSLMTGVFKCHQQGLSGSYLIQSIDDVDWAKSIITYFHPLRRANSWINIHPKSIEQFDEAMKQFLFERDKLEEYAQVTFMVDEDTDTAKIIHINPKFKKVEDGGLITSYSFKLES